MSLFDKIKEKRHNLTEQSTGNGFTNRNRKDIKKILSNKSITKKPAETRMGKGKGSPDSWVSIIKPGRILYEVDGLTEEQAKEAFRACSHKFSIKTKMDICFLA